MIIGLMGAAVIGSTLLQINWIDWSIKLNKEQFEKNVYAALNRIAEKVEQDEYIRETWELLRQDDAISNYSFQQEFNQFVEENDLGERVTLETVVSFQSNTIDCFIADRDEQLAGQTEEVQCNCLDCQRRRLEEFERKERLRNKMMMEKVFYPKPIAHRLDVQRLDTLIEQEMRNRGIYIEPVYGVYSIRREAFVIANGHYVVSDNATQRAHAGMKNLYNSEYRVDLFPSDLRPPGMLMIYFPAKASLLWASVWKTLLASILFTCIILGCFTYTIYVIFRQKKLSEMKTDFINNMTHEFKTPIATISLAADSIIAPRILSNSDKVKRFADIIKQENKRMNNQVEKVLQMARIDKREFKLNLMKIDLHEIINEAIGNASLQVEKRDGKVTGDLKAENPFVEGDLTHVSNIIHNLLDNANKYSPEEPEISVHTRNVANGVEVIVKDKGMGMSKEARKHIFDKFYRVHTGNLHDIKGFGLGLSYVKALMTAHQGQIDVKSELGRGSSFILTFPFKVKTD